MKKDLSYVKTLELQQRVELEFLCQIKEVGVNFSFKTLVGNDLVQFNAQYIKGKGAYWVTSKDKLYIYFFTVD